MMSKQQPKMYIVGAPPLPLAVRVPVYNQSSNGNSLDICKWASSIFCCCSKKDNNQKEDIEVNGEDSDILYEN